MTAINLIPLEVRQRQALRRRLRAWAFIVIPAAALSLMPFVLEARRRSQAHEAGAKLATLESTLRSLRRAVSATAAAVQDLDSQVARAKALRTKRSWAGLLASIARCLPEEVWLTSLVTEQGPPSASALRAGRAPSLAETGKSAMPNGESTPVVVVLDAATRLQLTGFAMNHERIYDLMSQLKDAGAFTSVELVKAGTEPIMNGRAVKFVLACGW